MKDLVLSIFNIFKYAGRFFTLIRNFFFNILLLAVVVVIIIALIPQGEVTTSSDTILRLNISGNIVEEKRILGALEKLIGESVNPDSREPETALQDILDIINKASTDANITVLLLNLKHIGKAGLNQLQTIGKALERFRENGKTVVAAEDYYSQTQYYLASYADKVIVNPMGGVDIHGFGVYRLYFKEAIDRLEINYNIFRVGSYKSAIEPFTRNSMSPEDHQQNELWLSAIWQLYADDIAKLRNISLGDIQHYSDNIAKALESTNGDPAQLALKTGLVDQVWSRQQINSYLASLTKVTSKSPTILSSTTYLDSIEPSYSPASSKKPKIGLIIAEGNILPGKQPAGMIGGDSLAALIKTAREDSQVKALVLRINSGGGSAFASEIIRQELLELKKRGKPVIVSMGSVAASGGYWIAADADQIWASQATITGSIGIFGAIPTFEKTLASLGIYSDGVGTTQLAAGLDLTQPLPDQLRDAIQQTIVHNYEQFLEIVANGRKIDKSQVAELAQGRVYDGKSAQHLGLVDKLGTLQNAIQAAADLANLTEYITEYIRSPVSVKEHFLRFLITRFSSLASMLDNEHPILSRLKNTLAPRLDEFLLFDDPANVYAHCLIKMTL